MMINTSVETFLSFAIITMSCGIIVGLVIAYLINEWVKK